jgi:site-specific DNA-methyltransferase (cytosine-N4-specific)
VTPYYQDPWLTIYAGDCRAVLAELPAESVHCVVTSPPYWGLRSYLPDGHDDKPIELGLEPTPEEYVANIVAVFREVRRVLRADGTVWLNLGDSYASSPPGAGPKPGVSGLAGINSPRYQATLAAGHDTHRGTLEGARAIGLKPKDLVGIPWRVAFALQADGWYLRSDIIWAKPNPMPESVTDRPTKAHEMVFLLTKSGTPTFWVYRDHAGSRSRPEPDYRWLDAGHDDAETAIEPDDWRTQTLPGGKKRWKRINLWEGRDYYYDADAVREPLAAKTLTHRGNGTVGKATSQDALGKVASGNWSGMQRIPNEAGANLRSVWTIATQPYPGSHFATFPEKLVEPCVKAGTSEKGVCPECGAPWVRVVERPAEPEGLRNRGNGAKLDYHTRQTGSGQKLQDWMDANPRVTTRWRSSCDCSTPRDYESRAEIDRAWAVRNPGPVPAIVLDPFAGSGTTGRVAQSLSRRAILIDLNGEYLKQAMERNRDMPLGLGA